jgi:hypothetical protein
MTYVKTSTADDARTDENANYVIRMQAVAGKVD